MSEDDFNTRLAALANDAQLTGALAPAAQIRRRGDRRRRNQLVTAGALSLALFGMLGAGIALSRQPPYGPVQPGASTAFVPPSASAATTAPAGTVPGMDRQVLITAADGRVLSVGSDGVVGTAPVGTDEARLFVLAPITSGSRYYLVKTSRLRAYGEPSCLAEEAGRLIIAACDAGAGSQLLQAEPAGADAAGQSLFELVVGGFNIEIDAAGVVRTERRGENRAITTFGLVDAGVAGDTFD